MAAGSLRQSVVLGQADGDEKALGEVRKKVRVRESIEDVIWLALKMGEIPSQEHGQQGWGQTLEAEKARNGLFWSPTRKRLLGPGSGILTSRTWGVDSAKCFLCKHKD